VLTENREVPTVVSAMQAGAYDYLVKPIEEQRLITEARNAIAFHRLNSRVQSLEREMTGQGFSGMVGQSPAMKALYSQLDKVARSDITVLVRGESGTGKELVARAIHENSSRRDGPFVAVNCAAIPATLQESEFFGHEKGSFTGATERRTGRFEQADGGTLFFDEVGELSLELQAKLLRVLQERSFTRVGGSKEIAVDVRVLAATHRDLLDGVQGGTFRQDLYYRLAVMEIDVPPLRDRGGDIPLLAQTFLEDHDVTAGREDEHRGVHLDALQAFLTYPWPGNVREFQNAIHRAAVLTDGPLLTLNELPPSIRTHAASFPPIETPPGADNEEPPVLGYSPTAPTPSDPFRPQMQGQGTRSGSMEEPSTAALSGSETDRTSDPSRAPIPPGTTLADLERYAVEGAMARNGGNVSATARELGISRSVLYRKLEKFGLRPLDHP
jgi:DNA-binding NtrC family response regulator